ncbi:RHS repeat protein [Streptomyces sp. ISL-36]|nr:RHS repeat protein [Streptomyces sp. ISL-36]
MNGRTLSFTHDKAGRRTGRTTPGGALSAWSYDAAGRRTELTSSGRRHPQTDQRPGDPIPQGGIQICRSTVGSRFTRSNLRTVTVASASSDASAASRESVRSSSRRRKR